VTDDKKRCGPHVELAANPAARITRCARGTFHIHVVKWGVTLQLSAEHFAEVAATFAGAFEAMKLFSQPPGAAPQTIH
jgi:hypothetical protein